MQINRTRKMILEPEKQDCAESISHRLIKTKVWRETLSAQYPDDPRNFRAIEALTILAKDATNLSDESWSLLKDQYDWDSGRWREAVSLAARQVGFRNRSSSFPHFLRTLIGALSLSNAA